MEGIGNEIGVRFSFPRNANQAQTVTQSPNNYGGQTNIFNDGVETLNAEFANQAIANSSPNFQAFFAPNDCIYFSFTNIANGN